ncbi:hypothetical protein BDD12DRAFT_801613 [Trichophaea hybrida]|nr:hypothetical protein BDD12DRAFT_801613 [Trichophaea hybrida]
MSQILGSFFVLAEKRVLEAVGTMGNLGQNEKPSQAPYAGHLNGSIVSVVMAGTAWVLLLFEVGEIHVAPQKQSKFARSIETSDIAVSIVTARWASHPGSRSDLPSGCGARSFPFSHGKADTVMGSSGNKAVPLAGLKVCHQHCDAIEGVLRVKDDKAGSVSACPRFLHGDLTHTEVEEPKAAPRTQRFTQKEKQKRGGGGGGPGVEGENFFQWSHQNQRQCEPPPALQLAQVCSEHAEQYARSITHPDNTTSSSAQQQHR